MFQHDINPQNLFPRSLSPANRSLTCFDFNVVPTNTTSSLENLPKTPIGSRRFSLTLGEAKLKPGSSLANLIPNIREGSQERFLTSTVATENHALLHGSASAPFSETRKLQKRAKSVEDSKRKHFAVSSSKIRSMPEVQRPNDQMDEFSEIITVSPFAHQENEGETQVKAQKPRAASFLIVQTKPLPPYFSNVKASPFSKGREKTVDELKRMIHSADKAAYYKVVKAERKKMVETERNSEKVLLDPKILERMCDFLEHGDIASLIQAKAAFKKEKGLKKTFRQKLLQKLAAKPDTTEQCLFWDVLVGFKQLDVDYPQDWTRHSTSSCQVTDEICKDLDRTLPEYDMFQTEEGRSMLLKVLMALSNVYQKMGYVQGLNSIVGITLFYLKEEQSFWLIRYLFEKLNVKGIFYPNFKGLDLLNYQLEAFLDSYLPDIYKMLKDNKMNISYYTYSWFITLFADNLKVSNVIKIWNYLLVKGLAFLVQFSLAIFSLHKNILLNMDIDEVGQFLKNQLRDLEDEDERLFIHALEFKVTKRLMKDLEGFYANGKVRVKLQSPKDKKPYWEQVPVVEEDTKQSVSIIRRPKDSASKEEDKQSNSEGQKLKPFFTVVINKITIDLPDTLKQFFRKSPSKTQPPPLSLPLTPQTPSNETQVTPKDQQDVKKDLTKIDEVSSFEDTHKDDVSVSKKATEQSKDTPSEYFVEDEKNEVDDHLKSGRQGFSDMDYATNGVTQKRSINTRSRKDMPMGVPSKIFDESESHEVNIRKETTPNNQNNMLLDQQESIMFINWDDLPGYKSDEETNNVGQKGQNENMNQDNTYFKGQLSIESNGPTTSDADFGDVDEEIPNSIESLNTRRGVGEYVMTHQSHCWAERKI